MAAKKKGGTDDARIEAAVRELAEMGVAVPTLLERLVEDERKFVALGGSINTALSLPRERAFDFPFMSPTLWMFLWGVRIAILAREESSRRFDDRIDEVHRLHDQFVTIISLKQGKGRRGRRKAPELLHLEKEMKATTREICLWILEFEGPTQALEALFGRERLLFGGFGLPMSTELEGDWPPFAKEIEEKRALVNEFRRGRQGMSWQQAAGHVAEAWAEEISQRSKRRKPQL